MASTFAPTLSKALASEQITASDVAVMAGLSRSVIIAELLAASGHPVSGSTRPESVKAIEDVFGYPLSWTLPVTEIGKPSGRPDGTHATSSRHGQVCPNCQVERSLSGICDTCD